MVGVVRVSPRAMDAAKQAMCSGVVKMKPCPIEVLTVSPAVQLPCPNCSL